LKARDPEAAVAAVQKHLDQVRRTTLDEMDQ
jgi:DNA-binding GntR family transcriptional regulator